jgi:hypothetical protein
MKLLSESGRPIRRLLAAIIGAKAFSALASGSGGEQRIVIILGCLRSFTCRWHSSGATRSEITEVESWKESVGHCPCYSWSWASAACERVNWGRRSESVRGDRVGHVVWYVARLTPIPTDAESVDLLDFMLEQR